MQRAVIVGGTLGLGTAIVFGAAALASVLFPNGGTVMASWNGGVGFDRGVVMPAPMPVPAVGFDDPVTNEKGVTIEVDGP